MGARPVEGRWGTGRGPPLSGAGSGRQAVLPLIDSAHRGVATGFGGVTVLTVGAGVGPLTVHRLAPGGKPVGVDRSRRGVLSPWTRQVVTALLGERTPHRAQLVHGAALGRRLGARAGEHRLQFTGGSRDRLAVSTVRGRRGGPTGVRLFRDGGRLTAGEGSRRLGRVLLDGIGTGEEIDVRTQVTRTDFDEIVTFSTQRTGDGPVSFDRNVHDGDAHSHVLNVGDHGSHVLVPADQNGITQNTGTGEGGEVTLDVALHALTPARSDPSGSELDAGDVGDTVLFLGPPVVRDRLVPVAAQQRQTGTVPRDLVEELDETGVVPGHGVPISGSVHGHRAVREKVSRVDEQRAAVHVTPPPSLSISEAISMAGAQPSQVCLVLRSTLEYSGIWDRYAGLNFRDYSRCYGHL